MLIKMEKFQLIKFKKNLTQINISNTFLETNQKKIYLKNSYKILIMH